MPTPAACRPGFRALVPGLFGIVLATAGCTTSQATGSGIGTGSDTLDARDLEQQVRADAVLERLAVQAVGLTAAVAREGRIVWSGAAGTADLERQDPVTPATRFRLYSVSKPMTAVAAARLLEEGRLDPDGPVQRYVPGFPDKGSPITVMQLATHTSGIRHYADEAEARSRRHCASVADAVSHFSDDPLLHPPGTNETYSSWGYVLLSAVIEGASGSRYEEAMEELVFAPLGLSSLAIDDPTRRVGGRPAFYEEEEAGVFAPAAEVDNTCKWGAGAWLGSAEDVARFGLVFAGGSFLQPETRQLFVRGQSVYRAQGWSEGGMAFLVVEPSAGVSVALLSNATGEALGPALQQGAEELRQVFGGGGGG